VFTLDIQIKRSGLRASNNKVTPKLTKIVICKQFIEVGKTNFRTSFRNNFYNVGRVPRKWNSFHRHLNIKLILTNLDKYPVYFK